ITSLEPVRLRLDLRQHLARGDSVRHRPCRIEDDVLQLVAKHRGLLLRLADYNSRLPCDLPIGDYIGPECRDVDYDEVLAETSKYPARALERQPQLLNPLLNRHVERAQGCRSGYAVRLQGMAFLESAHRFLKPAINGAQLFIAVRFFEVAGNCEPGGENRYAFVRQAEGKRWTAVYRWPASR